MTRAPWTMRARGARADAPLRLVCFPHAGVGPAAYREWGGAFGEDVDVVSLLLPGREGRLGETPYRTIGALIDDAADGIRPLLDRPFAFFGHSMGAVIAFEITRRLRDAGELEPLHLFVSGHRAPHLPTRRPPLAHLPDAAFIAEIQRRYDGIPADVLRHPDLLALVLPTLRADLAAVEGYSYRPGPPIGCPLSALGGIADEEATRDELDAWRDHAAGLFSLHRFDGGHFYLQPMQAAVTALIANRLRDALATTGDRS